MILEKSLVVLFLAHTTVATLPNIIFILTDDQGYADVGYNGSPIPTPNIDQLSSEGIRLTNYYTHPICTPSRAALMTGKYAVNVEMSDWAIPPNGPQGLDPKYKILPETLKGLGYSTHMLGKWHLGNAKKKYLPTNRGFDYFLGTYGLGINHFTKQIGGGIYDFFENEEPYWDNKTHATDIFTAKSLQIIEERAQKKDKPFFLYLAYTAPHDPLVAKQELIQEHCQHISHYLRQRYCGLIVGIDQSIGRVVEALQAHNLMDNTIIAFSSDNGGLPYSGGYNYPFRGTKMTVLEGGVRVPAFIYTPEHLNKKSNVTFNGLFHISDWYPTLLGFIGKNDQNVDGIDQHQALSGTSQAPRHRVHIHHSPTFGSLAHRSGKWKLIVGPMGLPHASVGLFNEPQNWIHENGNFLDSIIEWVIWTVDSLFGLENCLTTLRGVYVALESVLQPDKSQNSME